MTALNKTFAMLGVRDEIVRALAEEGIEHPFAIQELTMPLALAGDDLIGQARTGMGKTYAFGVPLLHRIVGDTERPLTGAPRALIVVPTRELCLQVYGDLAHAAKFLTAQEGRKFSVVSIYGGRPYEPQIESLRAGADVVVGTPGRLLDLAQQGHLQLGGLSVLVLDEADEMLDLGFLPDIERILRLTPDNRQSMLFSATMPDPIITLARTFMNQPTHIRAEAPHSSATHDTTEQFAYRAHALDKVEMVSRILQADGRGATMIFTRTKRTAQKVADELAERGFKVGAVHGDLGQIAREKALKSFRTGDDRRAGGHRRRRPRHRHRRHHARHQLPDPRRRAGLRAPHRPHRPGRQDRHSGHARRLGRTAPLDDDRQGAGPQLPRSRRDVLELAAPLRRARHPRRGQRFHRRSRRSRPPSVNRAHPGTAGAEKPRSRDRSRRRTRGGNTPALHVEGSATATAGDDAGEAATAEAAPAAGSAHSGRRRRRRRPGKPAAEASSNAG